MRELSGGRTFPDLEPAALGEDAGGGSVRRVVLALVLLGSTGLLLELLLLEHTEPGWQLAPLVVLLAGGLSATAAAVRPGRRVLRLLQGSMALFIATGVLGLYLHYRGNMEFELEMDATLRGVGLLWRSLHGATPALAPGAMINLGLFGLASAYRHPALRRREGTGP